MSSLTKVILTYQKNRQRVRLLFGKPVAMRDVCHAYGVGEQEAFFSPASVFALELWEANDYGAIRWHIYILKAVAPGSVMSRLPQVSPGAEILLVVRGELKVRKVKEWLAGLKAQGHDLPLLDPDYYRSSHSKLKVRLEPRRLESPHGKVVTFLRTGKKGSRTDEGQSPISKADPAGPRDHSGSQHCRP